MPPVPAWPFTDDQQELVMAHIRQRAWSQLGLLLLRIAMEGIGSESSRADYLHANHAKLEQALLLQAEAIGSPDSLYGLAFCAQLVRVQRAGYSAWCSSPGSETDPQY